LGAFADNATLAVILGQLVFLKEAGRLTEPQLGALNAVYASLFFFPYVFLAPLAGFLNDRHSKRTWLVGGNMIRVLGTALAASSVWMGPIWQAAGYLMVGVGACVYSPAKYGVLPEIVARDRLVKANGLMEMLTVTAVLAGFVGGAALIDTVPVLWCYLILLGLFGASLLFSAAMTATPGNPGIRFRMSVDEFFSNLGGLLGHPRLFRVLCGTGLFWLSGAVMKMNFQPWGLGLVHLTDGTDLPSYINTRVSLYVVWLSVGIVCGSLLAGRLHRVGDLRFARVYGWGLAALIEVLGLIDLVYGAGFIQGQMAIVALLIAIGTAAGCFLIPFNAALQSESDPARLGKTIAAQNFVDNLAMLLAGGLVFAANRAAIGPSGIFLFLAAFVALAVTALKAPAQRVKSESGPLDPEI